MLSTPNDISHLVWPDNWTHFVNLFLFFQTTIESYVESWPELVYYFIELLWIMCTCCAFRWLTEYLCYVWQECNILNDIDNKLLGMLNITTTTTTRLIKAIKWHFNCWIENATLNSLHSNIIFITQIITRCKRMVRKCTRIHLYVYHSVANKCMRWKMKNICSGMLIIMVFNSVLFVFFFFASLLLCWMESLKWLEKVSMARKHDDELINCITWWSSLYRCSNM